MLVDDVSVLNLYLKDGSSFTGAINPTGQTGSVYVELDANSTWTLTEDSYVSSLTCVQGTINLNGHKLYVNGVEYDGSSASAGSAFEVASETSSTGAPDAPGGEGGAAPDGAGGSGSGSGSGEAPSAPPDGNGGSTSGSSGSSSSSEPPSKPSN